MVLLNMAGEAFAWFSPRCSHQPTEILALMLMDLDHSWTADLSAIWIPEYQDTAA